MTSPSANQIEPVVWIHGTVVRQDSSVLHDETFDEPKSFDVSSVQAKTQISKNERYTHSHEKANQKNSQSQTKFVKLSIDRIINIVDEHLAQLGEHHKQIKLAKNKLQSSVNFECDISGGVSSRTENLRWQVRDEQTKAIKTIKQLTNDLKELEGLEQRCKALCLTLDENTTQRLEKIRRVLVETTENFISSNKDIGNPIKNTDIVEAKSVNQRFLRQINQNSFMGSTSQIQIVNSDNEDECDKRQVELLNNISKEVHCREDTENRIKALQMIEKIERDTVELKRLFQEFSEVIVEQGRQTNSIEQNIVLASQHVNEGRQHLNDAAKLALIVQLTGCISGALIGGPLGFLLGGKLCGATFCGLSGIFGLVISSKAKRRLDESKIKYD